jgi:hypothetical protein
VFIYYFKFFSISVTYNVFCFFCRLLTIFCVINLLNYLDQGTIASNGVNGSRGTCTEGAAATCTSGSGIQ